MVRGRIVGIELPYVIHGVTAHYEQFSKHFSVVEMEMENKADRSGSPIGTFQRA